MHHEASFLTRLSVGVREAIDDIYGSLRCGEVEHVGSVSEVCLEWSCCGSKRDVGRMAGPPSGVMASMHDVSVDVAVNHESTLEYVRQAGKDLGFFRCVLCVVQPHGEGGVSDVSDGFGHMGVARRG